MPSKTNAITDHINKQISNYLAYHSIDLPIKNKLLYQIFQHLVEEICALEEIELTTLFSRISFLGAKFKMTGNQLFLLHTYRKENENNQGVKDEALCQLGLHLIDYLLITVFNEGIRAEIDTTTPSKYHKSGNQSKSNFKKLIAGLIIRINSDKKELQFIDYDDESQTFIVKYDVKGTNAGFTKDIERIPHIYTFPISCNLIDVNFNEEGILIPNAFVLNPDFLIDVTAIANCFSSNGTQSLYYLLNKFKPNSSSIHLLLGNVVNFFLDEIVRDKNVTFSSLLPSIFTLDPLGFSLLSDGEVIQLVNKAKLQFDHLHTICWNDFNQNNIKQSDIYLEPSFFSRDFGIQGRLDILHIDKQNKRMDIVELKSGKIFKPNVYGLNQSHYVQTLLYDLIIQSVTNHQQKARSYILYSQEKEKGLKFAPLARAQQFEALNLRNSLMSIEQILSRMNQPDAYNILNEITKDNFPKAAGFNLRDIQNFEDIYRNLDVTEQAYFNHFTAFIAREHKLAKLGNQGLLSSKGQASLWLESNAQKEEQFSLLQHLIIVENEASTDRPFITLQKTHNTSHLANFRKGDIVVLYPNSDEVTPMLRHQIFKCSLIEINDDKIILLLRNKQNNLQIFEEYDHWNIESDMLDKGFQTMYKNLLQFASAPKPARSQILCRNVKEANNELPIPVKWETEGLSSSKSTLIHKILNAREYFLLWGPPGTGKTSIMIRQLVKNLHEQTNQNILLLAYTNRAVDEICDAVASIAPDYISKMIRIGSSHSAADKYQDILLQNKTKSFQKRQALRDYLLSKRIFIGTVSSMIGKHEIFKLKKFDTLIIDEASQILEPMIVGLLPMVKKFILIGDHKQLPAIVIQKQHQSKVEDQHLLNIGLTDCRTSLFERLYLTAKRNNWNWLYDTLSQQGRMHDSLMSFPNQQFYNNELSLVPDLNRLTSPFPLKGNESSIQQLLSTNRKLYFPTTETNLELQKTNHEEANLTVEIIQQLEQIQLASFNKKDHFSIGIITPYRAQIALIKSKMEALHISSTHITVDTVERYQGGSRDIIIISFCINNDIQLTNLVSLSEDGTDRKLNVALTRAKEQIILIGNQALLSINPVYKQLIHEYQYADIEIIQ